MSTEQLRLREEFVSFFDLRGAWPSKREARQCFPSGFVADKTYLSARKGNPHSPEDLADIVQVLCRHPASKHILIEFLESIGYPIPPDAMLLNFKEVTTRLTTSDAPITIHEDKFLSGLDWVLANFARLRPQDICQLCRPERADEVTQWAYVTYARALKNDPRLPEDEAIKFFGNRINLPCEEFARRIRSWMVKSPWIVVNSWQPVPERLGIAGYETGTSVITPVTHQAYESVRAGEIEAYDIGVNDIEVPSRSLIVQKSAERPSSKDLPREINPTKSLSQVTLVQSCVLARKLKPKDNLRVRILVPCGNDTNAKRLTGSGFKRVDPLGPKSGVPMYEFVLAGKVSILDGRPAVYNMFLNHFASIKESPSDHICEV